MAAPNTPRPLLISRWASRASPRALRAGYVGVDERSFAEILAESVHFSRFLRYFDSRDVPDGTWESLLSADRSMSFALLATLDVGRRSAAIEALAERVRREEDVDRKEELLRRLIGGVLRLAEEIDRWLGPHELLGADGHGARHLLEHEIRDVLAPRLRRLLAIIAAVERDGLFREILSHRVRQFRSIWLVDAVEALERRYEAETWIAVVLDEIAEHVQAFLDGVAALARGSAAALEASLDDGDHAPHVGLLMAFARLFRHAQDELNALPKRVAAFYRENVLLERPRPALPDRTYLAFRPVPRTPAPEIPAGLLFPAGVRDDGTPIEFAADGALAVTGARLAAIRVWQPIVADGSRQRLNAAAAPLQPDGRIGMNLFAAPALPPARLGLIVAAPLLELRSGIRVVTIRFLGLDAFPQPVPDDLASILKKAFRLSYTNPSGWIDVPPAATVAEAAADGIVFRFAIAADGPALAPGAGPDAPAGMPDRPAVRFILVQDMIGDTAPLAFFGGLHFSSIRVETSVEGLSGLVVSNSAGPAAASAGVAPFGPVPVQGSWLRIDHPAFTAAPIDRIELGLSWLGLPPGPDGFTGYYRQYVVGPDREVSYYPLFTDEGFRVDLCAPVGGGKLVRNVRLFDPVQTPEPASPETAIAEPMPIEALPGDVPAAAVPVAPDDRAGDTEALLGTSWFRIDDGAPAAGEGLCPDGAILVTLAEPPYSFGASLYAVNAAYASSLIAAGEGHEIRRESLAARLWRGLLKLLKKLLALLLDALKAVIAPATMLWKLLSGGARWLRDLIFIRTDFYSHPDGMDFEPVPLPVQPSGGGGEIAQTAAFPNPPWEPLLAAIRVNYASHASWHCDAGGADLGPDRVEIFHVVPLEAPLRLEPTARPTLLPALPERPSFDLRIADWPAGEPLSLLFLTGPRPGAGLPASRLSWQYRTDGAWLPLPATSVTRDETRGLTGTGILTLPPLVREKKSLSAMLARAPVANDIERPPPADEIAGEDDEDEGSLWLRATAEGPGFGFPPIARILPDALSLTRTGIGAREEVSPIPAGTINQAPGLRGIARIEQPIDSFGGAPAEEEGQLALRTSARLRHKERAVLGWDHEQLMLERFPGIERARVLPACSPDRPGRPAPGHLTAIVIPARGGATPPDPLRPATPDELRNEIALWLGRRCSPFARIHVVDPVYDPVNIRVLAWFGAEKQGAAMLRDDLADLLSPWSEAGLDLPDEAGPRALQARILQFVRARPYVASIQSVHTDIAEAPAAGGWRIPIAGSLDIGALDRPPATGC